MRRGLGTNKKYSQRTTKSGTVTDDTTLAISMLVLIHDGLSFPFPYG